MRLVFLALLLPAAAAAAPRLHHYQDLALAPDGQHVAAIESDETEGDTPAPLSLVVRDLSGHAVTVALPCTAGPNCKAGAPAWGSDGRLSFLLARPKDGMTDIFTVDAPGGRPHRVLSFAGPLDGLRYGPEGRLAVLATANAHKNVGRTEAGAPQVGEIGSEVDEQRIALVEGGGLRFVSPANLYVYEYDFVPGGGFVGTAAPGDGDSQWWVAKLFAFGVDGKARVLFSPAPREQLASPVVSADGRSVAFIGGWMSDFGSTGGDAYVLALGEAGAAPRNLTEGWHQTVTAIDWGCGAGLTGVTLGGDTVSIRRLDEDGAKPVWAAQASLSGGAGDSLACNAHGAAAVVSSFAAPPEIFAGSLGRWQAITHANDGIGAPFTATSVTWRDDGFDVQGWLLKPDNAGTGKRPMVVLVHGGPEAAATDSFQPASGIARSLLDEGYDVFEPNYRGSFGQGERFASASIRDIGGGDWRDVLSGVDAAEKAAPVDDARLGIMGGSYGGYMTMWAVTQTHRFRAGVSHAGVSDWLSIEGEAPQAGSDEVNFGGSVYDNATPYLKASPIMHMRGVTTPVLITVGERDLECPMPQSEEFNTAMQALGVPSAFYVYAGEGHRLVKAADREDFRRRTIGWFRRWFKAGGE